MKYELLTLLRCPETGLPLALENAEISDVEITHGWLVTQDGKYRYEIRNSIPRFVPTTNYADNFGMQWNHFRQTQLDSHSKLPISAERFWAATGWNPQDLRGQWVLDIGCGAGRFAEIALEAGAHLVALDYSTAVDACYENLKHYSNLHVVQGDIYALPFIAGVFPFVYSLGVLQHTPNVAKAFAALPPMVTAGGRLCTDFYFYRLRTLLQAKYLIRPITKRMSQPKLFRILEKSVPGMLTVSDALGRLPIVGRALKRLIPVANYSGIYPLSKQQVNEWALLDTFDMLAPEYDKPQSVRTIRRWFEEFNFVDVDVFHCGHLVGRGRKPIV